MPDYGDPSLDALLVLDGESFVADPAGTHWVKFVVRSATESQAASWAQLQPHFNTTKPGSAWSALTTRMPRPPAKDAEGV
jgi:hypothetical protein